MLTIGEFSRLGRVSPRMLRHYDTMGLLCPEQVGENGYRYYKQEQLSTLVRILKLNGYGFRLSELGELLGLSDKELLPRLRQRYAAGREEQAQLTEQLGRMEADILRMEGKVSMENQYHIVLLEDPEQKVFSIRRTIGVAQFRQLFDDLWQEAEKRGLKQAGPIQMLYYDENFDHDSSDVEAQMVVAGDGPDVKVKPACTCAALEHKGTYENLPEAYAALLGWLAEHPEYRMCGPAVERYWNAPDSVPAEELRTGVLFPVEKR